MTFRKSILLLISLSMIAALVACSSSSTTTTPPPPAITVTLTSPATFPTVLYVNDTLSVTATVANDSANGGVIWSCSPGNSAATCGS
jgi:ABC-type glycerol-3-phosphate transport system substrate-binding protein